MRRSALVVSSLAFAFAGTASAAPIQGEFNIAGSLRASSTTIDFLGGTGENSGTFVTLEGGTGYFSTLASTSITSPFTGTAADLTPTSANVNDFLSGFTAPTYAGLSVGLTQIVAPTAPACTGSEGSNSSCSLGYFTVTNLGERNTALAIVVTGSAEDSNVPDSSTDALTGRLTSQTGLSIQDLMTAFNGNGITASYSGNFNANEVPEPGMLLLLGMGLAASGMLRRKLD
jgi:hypothetical protein